MRFWGIAPKVSLFAFLYALLAFYGNSTCHISFRAPIIGLILIVIGTVLWNPCSLQVMRAYRNGKLVTSGCYSRIRHPVYSIWGFFIIPGFSIAIGGFMLGLPIVYWLAMLAFIDEEERFLEERFGDEWQEYARRTPRFLPRL